MIDEDQINLIRPVGFDDTDIWVPVGDPDSMALVPDVFTLSMGQRNNVSNLREGGESQETVSGGTRFQQILMKELHPDSKDKYREGVAFICQR